MTTDTDKLIQSAEAAGFRVVRFNDAAAYACDDEGKDITPKLAAFASAHIAALCGDVEPVAWLHIQGAHTEAADRELWDDERKRGWTQEPLCHASTVAALKADAKQSEKHRNDLADANTDLRTQVAALKARVAELEQGAQPGADVVMVPRKPNAVQVAAGNRVTWPFPCEQVYRVMIDAFAAAPQPQQEQSK